MKIKYIIMDYYITLAQQFNISASEKEIQIAVENVQKYYGTVSLMFIEYIDDKELYKYYKDVCDEIVRRELLNKNNTKTEILNYIKDYISKL